MRMAADVRQHFPTPLTFFTCRFVKGHRHTVDFRQGKGIIWCPLICDRYSRRDANVVEGHGLQRFFDFAILDEQGWCRL